MISVHVLLYGDHPDLAKRCLDSILESRGEEFIQDLRIGFNSVCPETESYVWKALKSSPIPWHVYTADDGHNVLKYPLMRRMFNDPKAPLAPLTMWFDDDSFLRRSHTWYGKKWWTTISQIMQSEHLIGAKYGLTDPRWRPGQLEGIKQQPWYTGKEMRRTPRFVTGGWWTIRSAILKMWDYPFKEILHNSGDVLLGALFRQRNMRMFQFNDGVAINADVNGVQSTAKRRGLSTAYPWEGYHSGQEIDLSHHKFICRVTRSACAEASYLY